MCDPFSVIFSEAVGFGAGLGQESTEGEDEVESVLVGPIRAKMSPPQAA